MAPLFGCVFGTLEWFGVGSSFFFYPFFFILSFLSLFFFSFFFFGIGRMSIGFEEQFHSCAEISTFQPQMHLVT